MPNQTQVQALRHVGHKPKTPEQSVLDDLRAAVAELQERERARDPNWSPRRPITQQRPG